MVHDHRMRSDAETLEDWEHDGFVRLTSELDASALSDLREVVGDIASGHYCQGGSSPVLVHHEQTPGYLKRSADTP